MTTIVSLADPHFRETNPVSRKDDFCGALFRKFHWIYERARQLGAASIAIAGDIFDQPRGQRINRRLDHRILELIEQSPCPWDVIPGNHDLDHVRMESLENHPLGILERTGAVSMVCWPSYTLRGDDPPVVVTGKEYRLEGISGWLEGLRVTGDLRSLKESLGAGCLALTHGYWADGDSEEHGEPVLAHSRLLGTGIEVAVWGHPHRFEGINKVPSGDRVIYNVGPGALMRGTLAEHDTTRTPRMVVARFHGDGGVEVDLEQIPCEPAEHVFDLAKHERIKRQRKIRERSVEILKELNFRGTDLESLVESQAGSVPPGVLKFVNHYLNLAQQES